MDLSDFDYELPSRLIATRPAARRDGSRLLVLDRRTGKLAHRQFYQLVGELRSGDCLVLNDSRVIPARLEGRRAGGGRVEFLLLSRRSDGDWQSLVKPAKKLKVGDRIPLTPGKAAEGTLRGAGGAESATIPGADAWVVIRGVESDGTRIVSLESPLAEAEALDRFGRMPLPPYILAARREEARADESVGQCAGEARCGDEDRERYQTVYAREAGSVAAPTAGLHFTPGLLEQIEAGGVEIQRVTLHVGAGTFAPVKARRIEDHVMHAEEFEIGEAAARSIEAARRDPRRRVVAVGTTVARTLESCMLAHGTLVPTREPTRLLIAPGFQFQAIEALLTNFHLPRSTLMMLVSAFAGREATFAAYEAAIREGYRFYSYGDAMLIR